MLIINRIALFSQPQKTFSIARKSFVVSVLFQIFTSTLTWSQDQSSVSSDLKGLINKAFEQNIDLQITTRELKISKLDMESQKASLLPRIDAYSRYHYFYDDQPVTVFPEGSWAAQPGFPENEYNRIPSGLPNNLSAGVLLEQRLFDYRFFMGSKSKATLNSIEQYRISDARAELAFQIATQFYQLAELESKKKLISFNKTRLQKAIKILSIQVESDMALQSELDKTKLKLEKTTVLEQRLNSGIEAKTAYIKTLAGIPDSSKLTIAISAADTIPSLNISQTTTTGESPKYKLLEQMQQSNLLKTELARADHLPSLNFFADVNWFSQSADGAMFDSGNMNHQGFIGLKLDIPIYAGGSFRKIQQKNGIENEIYRLRQQQLNAGQKLQADRMRQELKSYQDEWVVQNKIEEVTLQQLKQAENRFEQGIIPINTLYEVEEEWQKAGTEKNELLLKIKLSELELLKASGQLEILYK